MDDITTIRKLTALRNKPGTPFHLKQRLTNMLNTAEEANRETADPVRREQLFGSLVKQWGEYEAARRDAA